MSATGSRGRLRLRLAALALASTLLSAHVGSDDVYFVGRAGPWGVRVSVRQPGVIPGLADITVHTEGGTPDTVLVTALRRIGAVGQAPPPDAAKPVPGAPGVWAAQLWFMTRGAYSVIVTVAGSAGRGTATVPVVARANAQLSMPRGLGFFILAGGLFLVVGMLTIVGAGARESVLAPGVQPGAGERRRARFAMAAGSAVLALMLFGGWTWIQADAREYRARVDRPWSAQASLRETPAGAVLHFAITDSLWVMRDDSTWRTRNGRYRRADLIPDHGKLMHMFLVREGDAAVFGHVHPVRVDANSFDLALPTLAAGRYRVYADLVHADGFSHTMVAEVEVPGAGEAAGAAPATAARPAVDPDDAWWQGSVDNTGVSTLADGSIMTWVNGSDRLAAGQEAELVFRVNGADGATVTLDPYMGMAGHTMMARDDGQVFLHLHPVGTFSMAAQEALERNAPGGTSDAAMAGMMLGADQARYSGDIRFPLLLPKPGHYRIWAQVRRGDRVLTGAFDAQIH